MRDSIEAQRSNHPAPPSPDGGPDAAAMPGAEPEARNDGSRRTASTAGWGLAGFLIGAMFWHFIGFWSFVSDIVYKGPAEDGRAIAQTGQDCTELALDRATGKIYALPCPNHASQLAEVARGTREDSERLSRLKKLASPRWTVEVSQETHQPERQ